MFIGRPCTEIAPFIPQETTMNSRATSLAALSIFCCGTSLIGSPAVTHALQPSDEVPLFSRTTSWCRERSTENEILGNRKHRPRPCRLLTHVCHDLSRGAYRCRGALGAKSPVFHHPPERTCPRHHRRRTLATTSLELPATYDISFTATYFIMKAVGSRMSMDRPGGLSAN